MHGLTRFFATLLTLLLVGLLGTGCASTKTVGPDGSPHRSEINEEAEGNIAEVTLKNGEVVRLKNFRIDADSASGFAKYDSPAASMVSFENSRIEKIIIDTRDYSTLWWGAGIGSISGSILGFVLSSNIKKLRSLDGSKSNAVVGFGAGGTFVGSIYALASSSGSVNMYSFDQPPSIKKSPESKEDPPAIAEDQPDSTPGLVSDESEISDKPISTPEVDTRIPETNTSRPNDIAVVIGNTEYENADIPNVDYAVRDAQVMKKYLTRTLGFREKNIIYVENASGSALTRIFGTDDSPKGQLHNWVKPGESSVFVYYSGHGAPNPKTGNAYLIASNTNPNYLSQNGYPLSQLYENLAKVPAQSVTVALEACFSGTSEGGAVVQNASPAVLSVENPMVSMEQGLAFTAGATDQIASWYPEKKHGLFTYYFLNGLRGNADRNDDSAVTAKEMKSYLNEEVPYRARRMFNREQNPQVVGQNLDRVLVRYGDSAPAAQQKARLPVTTTNVEVSVKNALSLPDGAKKVTSVDDTDALRQDDVITAADGSDLESAGRLAEIVKQHAPGDTLRLKILREGDSQTVSVTLTASQ